MEIDLACSMYRYLFIFNKVIDFYSALDTFFNELLFYKLEDIYFHYIDLSKVMIMKTYVNNFMPAIDFFLRNSERVD